MDDISFAQLIGRVRAGDEAAASQLVRDHEPEIRAYIRKRLRVTSLQRVVDSADICQSVLAQFFKRLGEGADYDLETPENLASLLTVMAQNKLFNVREKERAVRRGGNLTRAEPDQLEEVAGSDPTPSQVLSNKESRQEKQDFREQVLAQLSPEERVLLKQWEQGRTWDEIAEADGKGRKPDTLKKQLHRALDRVKQGLGPNTEQE